MRLETQRKSSLSKVLAPVTRMHTWTAVALLLHVVLRGLDLANAFGELDALVKNNNGKYRLAENKASCL